MNPKRLLCLAASHFQVPLIRAAKERGLYVITCDYLPANPGHALADESHDVSTTDEEAVLALARQLQIDAVIAYASDPAVPTAARVAAELGLPGPSVETIRKLAFKQEFRHLQTNLGLPCPKAIEFTDYVGLLKASKEVGFSAVVKPVDASGSKGVRRADSEADLALAFADAMRFSRKRIGIIEEFIEAMGLQIHGDAFVADGRVAFACLGDHRFAQIDSTYTPVSTMLPSAHPSGIIETVVRQVDAIIAAAGYRCGPINIEARVDKLGRVVIIEVGPRNGGNFVPQLVQHATGVDMVGWCLQMALGEPLNPVPNGIFCCRGCYSHYILHSTKPGRFVDVTFSPHLQSRILEMHLFKRPGDQISEFLGSHATIGVLLLRYRDRADMMDTLDRIHEHVSLRIE